MAVRFSAVTVTSDKNQAEFLVSGIPKQSTDLVGWTAFDGLMRKVNCKQDIQVHVAACLYGDGEVFDATPEEVAYFTLRAKPAEHFFYNHCKDIGKSDFTIHFIPKNTNFKEKNTMNEWERNRRMAERMRESYPEGTRLIFAEWCDTLILCQNDRTLKDTLQPTVAKLTDVRVVNNELKTMLSSTRNEYWFMVALVVGNVPLLYLLNKEWFNTLLFTTAGKVTVGICGAVILITALFMQKFTKPIEYKR